VGTHIYRWCATWQEKHLSILVASVGLPLDRDARASYGTYEDGKVTLHRVRYDVLKVSETLHEHFPNPSIAQRLAMILQTGTS
jgi:hypothetical protein